MKKLYRSDFDKKLSGVCGGIARYLGMDSTIIRLVLILLTLVFHGIPVIFYLLAWILMPGEPGYKTIEIKRD
ncbi:MAG: PspC domain-containing protein [Bacillota bacterium]